MMVSGGESKGVSPEIHDHLHGFERVQLQVVKTAPDRQLLNLLSVSKLVTVLNEANANRLDFLTLSPTDNITKY